MREGDVVRLKTDSQVAVAFVNRQGGTHSKSCAPQPSTSGRMC